MDFKFSSLEELRLRVEPALSTRESEFRKMGYSYITKDIIWDILSLKWKSGYNLNLCDIVSDIMNISKNEIDLYIESNK